MQRTLWTTCFLGAITAFACGGGGSDGDDTGGDDDVGGGPDASTGPIDAPGARTCAPAPTRVVVVGDSITACSVLGGPQNAACVSKLLADYVTAEYAPGATYENYAVGGAVLADLDDQLATIPAGEGPVLLLAYIGGNDLAPFIFSSDSEAMQAWEDVSGELRDTWDATFETLTGDSRFPDGVTVLMNTQYTPFDDCTAPPYNLSAVKNQIIRDYNATLTQIAGAAGNMALIVDQYTPYLGHGHHYDVASCPHFDADAAPFMRDTIHANAAGNALLAEVLQAGADRLYRDCE